MAERFSLSEVFRMAEEVERSGVTFYKEAAALEKLGSVKEVLLDLAEREREHEQLFANWRQQYCGKADQDLVDPQGEVKAYIRLMADGRVFSSKQDILDILASVQSVQDALQLAISFEKDTIVFFTGLKTAVTAENWKKLELLIQEEVDHIRQLQKALAEP